MRVAVFALVVLLISGASSDPISRSATDRGLTATNIAAALLAEEGRHYFEDVTQKNFKGNMLAYVTPWNSHGYDVAVRWRAKFTHISPVWYQLRGNSATQTDGSVELTGGYDVDQKWVAKLRDPVMQNPVCAEGSSTAQTCTANYTHTPLIVPRFISELPPNELTEVLQKPGKAIAAIVGEVEKQRWDGLVFEGWLQWAAMGGFADRGFTRLALDFVKALAASLRETDKVLLLAVPPVVPAQPNRPHADTAHLQQLAASISGFSLMTYDYSAGDAGPNGPIDWQQENVEKLISRTKDGGGSLSVMPSQVYMGINFYGYDYTKPASASKSSTSTNAQAVMGDAFLQSLKRHKPKLVWQENYAEHRVRYKEGGLKHTIYYPTPASIAARVQLAERLDIGLSIWELGQGMDAFLDML